MRITHHSVTTREENGTFARLIKLKNIDNQTRAASEVTQAFIDGLNFDLLQWNELHRLNALFFQILNALLRRLSIFNDDSIGFTTEHSDDGELILLLRHLDELSESTMHTWEHSLHRRNSFERLGFAFILLTIGLCFSELGVEGVNLFLEEVLSAAHCALLVGKFLEFLFKFLQLSLVDRLSLLHHLRSINFALFLFLQERKTRLELRGLARQTRRRLLICVELRHQLIAFGFQLERSRA